MYETKIESNQIWVLPPDGPQYWGQRWVSVAPTSYTLVDMQACNVGPVFVLRHRNGYYIIKGIHFKTTNLLWDKGSSTYEPEILSVHNYGVRFRIGDEYYNTVNSIVNGPFSS